jgi:allantoate deiminase
MRDFTKQIMDRIERLSGISEEPGRLTRTFGSPAMRQANDLAARWMREAGMAAREDVAGNLIGHYETAGAPAPDSGREPRGTRPILVIGSHLDTVRNAGKFDGTLGVLLGIACVDRLNRKKTPLPFAIEVVAFADEEGVRFQSAYIGSRAAAGRLGEAELRRTDARGISIAEAIVRYHGQSGGAGSFNSPLRGLRQALRRARFAPRQLLGYLEAHIEQGPVLEERGLALGIVTAIAGQTRLRIRFSGKAGHAGACPMSARRDALCGAAEFILAVETLGRRTPGLVATVGYIQAEPNAGNVIPGAVTLSVDLRHQKDAVRRAAETRARLLARRIGLARGLDVTIQVVQKEPAAPCARQLSELLKRAVRLHQAKVARLPSGAGHDAAIMAGLAPMAMLFIRCKDGLSHHPAESVKPGDIRAALNVMHDFLRLLANRTASRAAPSARRGPRPRVLRTLTKRL